MAVILCKEGVLQLIKAEQTIFHFHVILNTILDESFHILIEKSSMYVTMKCLRFPKLQDFPLRFSSNREVSFVYTLESGVVKIFEVSIHTGAGFLFVTAQLSSAHLCSPLLQFREVFQLCFLVSATSKPKSAYSCIRTNNSKHQTQNEQTHKSHASSKKIQRNLT